MQKLNLEGLRRQPSGAVASMILKSFWGLLKTFWPFLAIVMFRGMKEDGNTGMSFYVSIGVIILAPLIGYFQYLVFRYGIVDNKFIIRQGIFKKEEISWPISSIQGIQTHQNFLDRMLRLVTVKLDATGTNQDKDELHITVDEANLLREIILEKGATVGSAEYSAAIEEETVVRDTISELSLTELLKLAITANHLRMLGIMLAFFFSFLESTKELLRELLKGVLDETNAQFAASGFLFVFYVTMMLVFLSALISFTSTLFQYANFKIKSHPKGLAVESGLINRLEQVVRLEKIQFISWKANLLRKKLPIYLLEFHSIGELDKEKLQLKLPITRITLLEQLIQYYGNKVIESNPFLAISKKYVIRTTLFRGLIPAIILSPIVYFFLGWHALFLILLPILVFLWHQKTQSRFKVYFNSDVLHVRKGAFGTHEILLNWKYVQSVSVKSSYYQRKHRLANLHLYTAGGTIIIPYLNLEDAQTLQDYAVYKVEYAEHLKWV